MKNKGQEQTQQNLWWYEGKQNHPNKKQKVESIQHKERYIKDDIFGNIN